MKICPVEAEVLLKRQIGLQLLTTSKKLLPIFKTSSISDFSVVMEVSRKRLRPSTCLSRGTNIVELPVVRIPGVLPSPTDLEGLRTFIAFNVSIS